VDHSRNGSGYELADLVLLQCALAWGFPEPPAASTSIWDRLEPAWRERLKSATRGGNGTSPEQALDHLRESLRQQSCASLDQVHASWWIRALQDESPAVRRLVASLGTPRVSLAVRAAFGIGAEELQGARLPDTEIARWVLALWSERLVGGEPLAADDPLVIVALAGLAPVGLYRLSYQAGLAKLVLAEDPEGALVRHPNWRASGDWYRGVFLDRIGPDELRPQALASSDLRQDPGISRLTERRRLATLGLTTLARLLVAAEAFRVRWALQHVPYPVAKRIRSIMARNPEVGGGLLQTEAMILEAVWRRLALEGRLAIQHPAEQRRTSDVP
jgi:hypothetical protein